MGISVKTHCAKLLEMGLYFHFYLLNKKQLVIWVSDNSKEFRNLHTSFPQKQMEEHGSTCLLGEDNISSGEFCSKLSKRRFTMT
jgi:hypothetical protein